ncbi:MAG: 4-hydroxy-tetrahydrodipicolinate synthase [Firmicutes bacterium]|nr:4-hydroxy-tetrahydrodipicolinate synthase [Bacillota bacterium]
MNTRWAERHGAPPRLITAAATPFLPDGSLNVPRFESLVEQLITTGSEGLVIAGTTGESPTLSHQEKRLLFEKAVEVANGRAEIWAGVGSNETQESAAFAREVAQLGVDGLLVVAPYYNRPTQEGLYRHFSYIAQAAKLPIMLYNIPKRTGVNVSPETVERLAEAGVIGAVKEADGDFSAITQLAIASRNDAFTLYSGEDALTLPMLSVGAYGVVSVASHLFGRTMRRMIDAYLSGDVTTAVTLHQRLAPAFEALFLESSPAPLKACYELLDQPLGPLRLPLVSVTHATRARLSGVLSALHDDLSLA